VTEDLFALVVTFCLSFARNLVVKKNSIHSSPSAAAPLTSLLLSRLFLRVFSLLLAPKGGTDFTSGNYDLRYFATSASSSFLVTLG
jgi:hypothetical protein